MQMVPMEQWNAALAATGVRHNHSLVTFQFLPEAAGCASASFACLRKVSLSQF